MDQALQNESMELRRSAMPEATAAGGDAELRARTYRLLGALFSAPPEAELLEQLAAIEPPPGDDPGPLPAAWDALRLAAQRTSRAQADDEYHALFIGIGRGELVPYGSWYMTGFLMEQPLVVLRRDLEALGIERNPNVSEPEDHVGALCETMSLLIDDEEIPFPTQRRFFTDHLAPWFEHFFRDLQQADSARFYRAVGRLGGAFTEFERKYLSMLA